MTDLRGGFSRFGIGAPLVDISPLGTCVNLGRKIARGSEFRILRTRLDGRNGVACGHMKIVRPGRGLV